ncbi:hypothetical protein F5J12DRAFT_787735 [Pisolithus orientalis]|uniref:uncharacterized protein n=1 Tax=Pisolithus orientalis TaxID=936130 RepID=UPI002223F5F4|nr:uncharacterized protein F5J12DRAFT_787735 [Pisolithus orientalis]KAI5983740.1 hypothetical protein F5J12DRAFT_787735 [Pisolithus orientalis]
MSEQAQSSQATTTIPPITLPCKIVTYAADIVLEELSGLESNRNRQYWQKAMNVIWEQLGHVHPLVEELPSKSTIPTHLIAAAKWMKDLAMLTELKQWPDFDQIRDAGDTNVVNHPWYQVGQPMDKGKGQEVPSEPIQLSRPIKQEAAFLPPLLAQRVSGPGSMQSLPLKVMLMKVQHLFLELFVVALWPILPLPLPTTLLLPKKTDVLDAKRRTSHVWWNWGQHAGNAAV